MELNDPTGKFCYSLDGEQYMGKFDTPGAAAAQAETDIDDDCEDGEVREYHVAECCHPLDTIMHGKRHLWTGERIVEQIDEWCGDEVAAEDWVLYMSKDDMEALGKLVLDFVRENAGVQYYGVKNDETHTYVAGFNDFNCEITKRVRERLLSWMASAIHSPASGRRA